MNIMCNLPEENVDISVWVNCADKFSRGGSICIDKVYSSGHEFVATGSSCVRWDWGREDYDAAAVVLPRNPYAGST